MEKSPFEKEFQKRIYNLPVGQKPADSTFTMRNPQSLSQLLYKPHPNINNLQDVITFRLKQNGLSEFVGKKNHKTGIYEYESFNKIFNQAVCLGSIIENMSFLKITDEQKKFRFYSNLNQNFNGVIKLIGLYCKNRLEWTICDMANALYGYTMVPIQESLGFDSVSYILAHSGLTTCICSTQSVEILIQKDQFQNLKNIILLDDDHDLKIKEVLEDRGIKIYQFQHLIEQGKINKVPLPKNLPTDTIFSLCYTSGTTGNPKAAMITHRNMIATIKNQQHFIFQQNESDTHISYLPLQHIYERFRSITCWYTGTKIAYSSGNILKLKEDIADIQPTFLVFVPRLMNKYFSEINQIIKDLPKEEQSQICRAIEEKLSNLKDEQKYTFKHSLYDEPFFSKFRDIFGGKIKNISSGSAPISQEVIDFLKVVLCCNVSQGYGLTESCGMATSQISGVQIENQVGGVTVSNELKLVDVPEMGYFTTDKNQRGIATPRGEICLRGHNIFAGYFKDDQKTEETFDQENWLHTGDIGVILPNGALRIIDRKKNLFKLQQGEYISPEKVENIYIRVRGVQEVFIYGDPFQRYCVAIIVPNPEELIKIANQLNIKETNLQNLCQNQLVNSFYLENLQQFGRKEGLISYEQAKKIYLEPVSFAQHGCLTQSMKLQRHIAKKVFQKVLDNLYSSDILPDKTPRL
ncbi:AMP-binding enzyme family protein (macronuclear) [Tetrahymena thermophila SB210]|uniref:AMP-binding enzyme family protein n=1 Tax=Tetrahymena thermophila (strain SB210) TaxID=312017 RepID=Q22KX6_TETTS|nr:AMP-binding enzyme family protein [Tetrahymena thermophila SB210]EAR85931.2 AMP-binding enzyme family protein [Tetrahymena thermophila SB210]|eukprot:XP_976526.2 AMP-binding enzyme family protein [Tetrahymena thermophila SB210]